MTKNPEAGGDLFLVSEFIELIKNGCIVDYDGTGYYATAKEYFEDRPALPSRIAQGIINKRFSHIMWFNK